MRYFFITLVVALVGCNSAPAVSLYYCSTPVGPSAGKGTASGQGPYATVTLVTETGVTVIAPWDRCVEVKE